MKVAVCLWVRNEEADIAEWIAFHLAVGFDTCIIMDNGSTDQTIRHAKRFSGNDRVRINRRAPDNQTLSYDQCLGKHGRDFDWIAFLDSDEFFVPRQGNVKNVLAMHDDAVAIAVNWAIYGSSGYIDPPKGLITESLRRRAEDGFEPNRHIKSFVRPSRVFKCLSPHAFSVDGSYVDTTGAPVDWQDPLGVRRGAPVYATCQINHYFLRSRTHWTAKLKRGYHDDACRHPVDDFIRYDRNEVEDDSALRFVSATKTILAEAKAPPSSRPLAGDAEADKAGAPARDRAA